MQFLLIDLTLTFAALVGYRAWQLVLRRAVPMGLLARPWTLLSGTKSAGERSTREPLRQKAARDTLTPTGNCQRAFTHRLINFW
ncbi:MAG TPA: hypothetical protein VMT66_07430 [Steroidobacteraceae bacterium]|nr:hypothetical protein [Steroidobacteraceae bacterium]